MAVFKPHSPAIVSNPTNTINAAISDGFDYIFSSPTFPEVRHSEQEICHIYLISRSRHGHRIQSISKLSQEQKELYVSGICLEMYHLTLFSAVVWRWSTEQRCRRLSGLSRSKDNCALRCVCPNVIPSNF